MDSIAISANVRSNVGQKSAKATRREGLVPCVIYGGENVIHFSATTLAFRELIYTADFKLAEIDIDGTTHKCILKDAQFHPVTDEIMHIDFLELVPGQSVKVMIPVKFRGQAPGVKVGGRLTQKVRKVKIKTVPEALVPELFVDISKLKLNESVRIKDIEVNDDMEVMTSMSIPVATVETPRALKSAGAADMDDEEEEEGSTEGADTTESTEE